ncbi:MAG: PD40 domain-containing protein [Chloroflexi bacterium]|nr:PD40 domain-containing protein [Chloroflexota bacterium]MBI3740188.1 PD40 domain-containing protein [Chloroflexota bacterium]
MKLRQHFFLIAVCGLTALISACASPTPTPRPAPPQPTAAPTQPPTAAPTATPVPPTATLTPVPLQATAKQQVNLRQGPSDKFPLAGKMPKDTAAIVLGKSEDGKWLQLAYPDAAHASWVLASFVNVSGALDQVAVVVPTATATPTKGTPLATRAATVAPKPPTLAAIPAPRGFLSFVTFDPTAQTFNFNNFSFSDKTFAPFQQLGPQPGDITSSTNESPIGWAPDGSAAAFVFGPLGASDFLRIMDRNGNVKTSFGHAEVLSPSWSPNSQELAYIGKEVNGAQSIFVVTFDLKRQERMPARMNAGLTETLRGVSWGKFIYFVSNYSGTFEIWKMNGDFNAGSAVQLTNDKRENGSPAESPDGTKIAYYSKQADNSYQIMIANADGSSPRKLTVIGNNFTPVWSPDGNWLAYFSTTTNDIMLIDKNGNNNQPLAKCPPQLRCQLPASWR